MKDNGEVYRFSAGLPRYPPTKKKTTSIHKLESIDGKSVFFIIKKPVAKSKGFCKDLTFKR